jgi:hypothetical protein
MTKEIIFMILGGILAGYCVSLLQKFFKGKAKEAVIKVIPEEDKIKLLELYKKGLVTLDQLKTAGVDVVKELGIKLPESFNGAKLLDGMINVTSKVGWAKDIASIFNLRKLLIIGVIIGVIYGAGWYMGTLGKAPVIDLKGKEEFISLNEHFLHIKKDGSMEVLDHDKKTLLKKITVKDVANLRKALQPYGVDIKYFACTGGSLGEKAYFESGLGVQSLKYYKWNINHFITNRGAYPIGLGYQITDNFDILAGYGIGYKTTATGMIDKRIFLGGKLKF